LGAVVSAASTTSTRVLIQSSTTSSVSSTHPAIEISTPRNHCHFHPTPYDGLALWGPFSTPPHLGNIFNLFSGLLYSGLLMILLLVDNSLPYPALALPCLALTRSATLLLHQCFRWLGTQLAVGENFSTGHGQFLHFLLFETALSDTNMVTNSRYDRMESPPLYSTSLWSDPLACVRVAGEVICDTGLGLMIGWFYKWRILSRKARSKV